jgi:hypothetical protein
MNHALTAYEGVEVQLHTYLIWAPDRSGQLRAMIFNPQKKKSPRFTEWRLGWPQSQSAKLDENINTTQNKAER